MAEDLTAELKIVNELGMHTRPASRFVKEASKFIVDVIVEKDGMKANGKSIMGLLMLAAEKGSTIKLQVKAGPDQAEAFEALKKLISDGFGE